MDLDPRWDWVEITSFADDGPVYIKGSCNHLDLIDVVSTMTGEKLARLCPTCDAQLPPEREEENT